MQSTRSNRPEVIRLGWRVHARRALLARLGGGLIAAAAATAASPLVSPMVIGAAAGWLLWLAGALMIGVSLLVGARRSIRISLLASLVAVAGGGFLLLHPTAGALAVSLLVAAVLIVDGALELALALDLRPLRVWRWLIASAMASGLAMAVLSGAAAGRSGLAWALSAALASSGLALLAPATSRRRLRYSGLRAEQIVGPAVDCSPSTPSI